MMNKKFNTEASGKDWKNKIDSLVSGEQPHSPAKGQERGHGAGDHRNKAARDGGRKQTWPHFQKVEEGNRDESLGSAGGGCASMFKCKWE